MLIYEADIDFSSSFSHMLAAVPQLRKSAATAKWHSCSIDVGHLLYLRGYFHSQGVRPFVWLVAISKSRVNIVFLFCFVFFACA